jgi:hypothetical protein
MNCRYCHKPIEDGKQVKTLAYWNKTPDFCHVECRLQGEREEAIECQTIDADCNDCAYYQRGKIADKVINKIKTPKGEIKEVIFNPQIYVGGHCIKLNKTVEASPNKWSGLPCFEHRNLKK